LFYLLFLVVSFLSGEYVVLYTPLSGEYVVLYSTQKQQMTVSKQKMTVSRQFCPFALFIAVAVFTSTWFYIDGMSESLNGFIAFTGETPVLCTQKRLDWTQNDLFRHVSLKTVGDGWKMWDRSSPLTFSGTTCHWAAFRPAHIKTETPMCIYNVTDDNYVSGLILQTGRWPDCDLLPTLWNTEHRSSSAIYIEIGANIGSCIMEMLLSTNATIVAFEPDPRNLALLTSTLMAIDSSYRNRIALFPIALGATKGNSTINQAANNRGNSVVGKVVKDYDGQDFLPPISIQVETLDSIFESTKDLDVFLMKMDVQGFECYVVDGGRKVLSHTTTIKTELEAGKLRGHDGCSETILVDKLVGAGFPLQDGQGMDIVVTRNSTG
jgi:FkbM family methyltransferase